MKIELRMVRFDIDRKREKGQLHEGSSGWGGLLKVTLIDRKERQKLERDSKQS